MIRKDDWKLVMNHYGNGELYNLKKDPSEVHNLFGEKKYSEIQTELLTRLLAWELRLQDRCLSRKDVTILNRIHLIISTRNTKK